MAGDAEVLVTGDAGLQKLGKRAVLRAAATAAADDGNPAGARRSSLDLDISSLGTQVSRLQRAPSQESASVPSTAANQHPLQQRPPRALAWILVWPLAAGACNGALPTAPTASTVPGPAVSLGERLETAHFTFLWTAGDRVDSAWQETFHDWATATLGIQPMRRITYNKYRSREHMREVVGVGNANAYADGPAMALHTIWPMDNHEVIHLYSHPWGMPVALFSEGLAVAHQTNPAGGDLVPRWSGTPLHALARQFRTDGRLVPISRLATSAGFRSYDSTIAYPESGSFVRYVIDTRGLDRMRTLFGRLDANSSEAAVTAMVQTIYGESLEALEREWITFLDQI